MIDPEIFILQCEADIYITLLDIKEEDVDIGSAVSILSEMLAAFEKDDDDRSPVDLKMLL